MKKKTYDLDMAIWMRRAGLPVSFIAEQLGTGPARIGRDTHRHAPFDMREWLAFEGTLFKPYDNAFTRARNIAAGRNALAAFRRRRARERKA